MLTAGHKKTGLQILAYPAKKSIIMKNFFLQCLAVVEFAADFFCCPVVDCNPARHRNVETCTNVNVSFYAFVRHLIVLVFEV